MTKHNFIPLPFILLNHRSYKTYIFLVYPSLLANPVTKCLFVPVAYTEHAVLQQVIATHTLGSSAMCTK